MAVPFTTSGLARKLEAVGLGTRAQATRIIQHYTSEGLLQTVGAVNTGTGKRRMYPPTAFIRAAILFRLNRLGMSAGVMKELLAGLHTRSRDEYSLEFEEACKGAVKHPCLVLGIPDGPRPCTLARLVSASEVYKKGGGDIIVIDLQPYL